MHKAKNIYLLFIKKERDGPRQGTFPYRISTRAQENCGKPVLIQFNTIELSTIEY